MANFNITVELDWIGEEGSIDEELKEQIATQIISKVCASAIADITTKVDAQITKRVNEAVGVKLNEVIADFLTKPRTVTDKWGDVVDSGRTVVDMLKDACDGYIEQKVDYSGRPTSSYNDGKKRITYITDKLIDEHLKKAVDDAAKRIQERLQDYIKSTMQERLTENISKAIGLEQIVNSMK